MSHKTNVKAMVVLALAGVSFAVAAPEEEYKALQKAFNEKAYAFRQATNDAQRNELMAELEKLPQRLLELAEKNPKDPLTVDALIQVVNQELYLENNTTHPGRGKDSPQTRAIALLLRDHLGSDKLGEACWRMSYGFSGDCEKFLRTVLASSPHREVQGMACFRLANFLNGRLRRLDLLKEQPEMARRYEALFGKDYLALLQQRDRADALKEIETFFALVVEKYSDVKLWDSTIGEMSKGELYEIHHLIAGKPAPDLEGTDQNGQPLKLSDYRGKTVLLYFWSEY